MFGRRAPGRPSSFQAMRSPVADSRGVPRRSVLSSKYTPPPRQKAPPRDALAPPASQPLPPQPQPRPHAEPLPTTPDPNYITAGEVAELRSRRGQPEQKAFEELMGNVQRKIRTAVLMGMDDVVWTIPERHVDLPLFNQTRLLRQIERKLQQNSFYTKRIRQDVTGESRKRRLYISWRHAVAAAPTSE